MVITLTQPRRLHTQFSQHLLRLLQRRIVEMGPDVALGALVGNLGILLSRFPVFGLLHLVCQEL
jgi:hypothetical protein